eukprot:49223-Chlamydomonas_euryale.AAC.4
MTPVRSSTSNRRPSWKQRWKSRAHGAAATPAWTTASSAKNTRREPGGSIGSRGTSAGPAAPGAPGARASSQAL